MTSTSSDPGRAAARAIVAEVESLLREQAAAGRRWLCVPDTVVERLGPVGVPRSAGVAADPDAVLGALEKRVSVCTRCPLHEGRTQTVFGTGSAAARLMFVGEAPGRDEDRQGVPFVGRAGELLTRIIEAMGLTREQVYIGNIIKCRPPENRTPMPDEMATCLPYLEAQIAVICPEVIVALGKVAVQGLLDVKQGITRIRGQWLSYKGTPLLPTFHPAYLLRNPGAKREVWDDMKAVLQELDLPVPTGRSGRRG
jgi:DNA polymerase